MRHNRKKLNQSIMYGIMAMAVLVLLVILLFWYMMIDPSTTVPVPEE